MKESKITSKEAGLKALRSIGLVFFSLGCFFGGCVPKPLPVLLPSESPVGEGGRLARELYKSYWRLPTSDQDFLRIGILENRSEIRFQALQDMKIRMWSESQVWDVASPSGVIWKVRSHSILRPALVTYYCSVQHKLIFSNQTPSLSEAEKWKTRGFVSARWVGPPPIESIQLEKPAERWFLSLSPPTSLEEAKSICAETRKTWKISTQVMTRVELPPLVRLTLSAENSSFSKDFEGWLELISPQGPVRVFDVIPEERTQEKVQEDFGPRLFIIPGLNKDLFLVQSTRLQKYLEAVVPSEIFPEAPAAALRAQAVVARTYVFRSQEHISSERPYFICATTKCQVYRGLRHTKEGTSQAVLDTSNLILWENQKGPAEVFYHSICGGHTEPRKAIWGSSNHTHLVGASDQIQGENFTPLTSDDLVAAYLREPPNAYCGISRFTKKNRWRWSEEIEKNQIQILLKSLSLKPPLLDIVAKERGISGRILALEFKTSSASRILRGEYVIRQRLGGLLSSLFIMEPTRNEKNEIIKLKIHGGGYGHGVGLCQLGAIGRAEEGQTYQDILSAYFPNTTVAPIQIPMLR